MSLDSTLTATAHSRLPNPAAAGFADKLYRLDGGHSACERRSFGLNYRRKCRAEHRILVDLLADKAGKRMVTYGIRVFLNLR